MVATVSGSARGPKVVRRLGNHTFSFASTSELRDALLASFEDATHLGGDPVIGLYGDKVATAWAWLGDLARSRSDWQEAAGIALQHAVTDGPDLARRAFCDLMACDRGAIALARWTAPLAARWPGVKLTMSLTGWGLDTGRTLAAVMADQQAFAVHATGPDRQALLPDWNGPSAPRVAPMKTAADLGALLAETVQDGRPNVSEWGDGPWGWLYEEVVFRPWVRDALPAAMASVIAAAADPERAARTALDWLSAEWDLWRFEALLAGWRAQPPAWAPARAKGIPQGWLRVVRAAQWPNVATLGDIISALAAKAATQTASPPWIDLPEL